MPGLHKRIGFALEGFGIERVEAQGLVEQLDCRGRLTLLENDAGLVIDGRGKPRLQLQGFLVVCQRLRCSSDGVQLESEVVESAGIFRALAGRVAPKADGAPVDFITSDRTATEQHHDNGHCRSPSISVRLG